MFVDMAFVACVARCFLTFTLIWDIGLLHLIRHLAFRNPEITLSTRVIALSRGQERKPPFLVAGSLGRTERKGKGHQTT